MGIDALDHVQVAAPPGCEREARRFFTNDPWGNRVELLAPSAFPVAPLNVKGGW